MPDQLSDLRNDLLAASDQLLGERNAAFTAGDRAKVAVAEAEFDRIAVVLSTVEFAISNKQALNMNGVAARLQESVEAQRAIGLSTAAAKLADLVGRIRSSVASTTGTGETSTSSVSEVELVEQAVRERVIRIAVNSDIARVHWDRRGVAPAGYIKGMALVYANVYNKLKAGDKVAIEMAKAKSKDRDRDALAWYDRIFADAGMNNDVAGGDTLRHLFVLLIGLGMRESSGEYCTGRDQSAENLTAETAEAGLFQTSFNARHANSLLPEIFDRYSQSPVGFLEVFKEGVQRSDSDLENFGSGDGEEFQ